MEIDFDTYAERSDSCFIPPTQTAVSHHESIYHAASKGFLDVTRVTRNPLASEHKINNALISRNLLSSRKVTGSGEAGATWSWGGPDGSQFTGYGKVEVHDDNGNYAKVEAEQNSDGTGQVSVSGGHEEE